MNAENIQSSMDGNPWEAVNLQVRRTSILHSSAENLPGQLQREFCQGQAGSVENMAHE